MKKLLVVEDKKKQPTLLEDVFDGDPKGVLINIGYYGIFWPTYLTLVAGLSPLWAPLYLYGYLYDRITRKTDAVSEQAEHTA